MNEFDPYYKWLGIPPNDQPPNHYRLLGIELYESDPDVIDAAAQRASGHVRHYATGPHVAESQKILGEVAAARLCLLNPAKKAEYDRQIGHSSADPLDNEPPVRHASPAGNDSADVAKVAQVHRKSSRRTAAKRPSAAAIAFASVGVLGLFGLLFFLVLSRRASNETPRGKKPDQVAKSPGQERPKRSSIDARKSGRASEPTGKARDPERALESPTLQPTTSADQAASRTVRELESGPSSSMIPGPVEPPATLPSQTTSVARPPFAIAPFDAAQAKQHQRAWSKYLGAPVEMTNSIGMKLALIPAGEFLMGSPESEREREPDEHQHPVRITRPFYLGMYEVMQAEYERVMGGNPSAFSPRSGGRNSASGMDSSGFPVESVSWDNATSFCLRLSSLEEERSAGRVYRLPTEAEWEFACRGGTTTRFGFGDDPRILGEYAWYVDNSGSRTYPVGKKKPNAWGLYDMHGNVWEWCQDWYDANYYESSPVDDPPGPRHASDRVPRGGSWDSAARGCRSADRGGGAPSRLGRYLGFRVALVLSGR